MSNLHSNTVSSSPPLKNSDRLLKSSCPSSRDASPHSQAMIAAMHALHLSNTLPPLLPPNKDVVSGADYFLTDLGPDFINTSHKLIISTHLHSFTPHTSPLVVPNTSSSSTITITTVTKSSSLNATSPTMLNPCSSSSSHCSTSPTSPVSTSWAEIASAPATPFVDARSRRLAQLLNNTTNLTLSSTHTGATSTTAGSSYPSLTSPLNPFPMDPWIPMDSDQPTASSFPLNQQHNHSVHWPRVRARTTSTTPAQLFESQQQQGHPDLPGDSCSPSYLQHRHHSAAVNFIRAAATRSPKLVSSTAPTSPLNSCGGANRWHHHQNEWFSSSTWGEPAITLGLVPEESANYSAGNTPHSFTRNSSHFLNRSHVRSATTIPSSSGLAPFEPYTKATGLSEEETLELMQLRERLANRNTQDAKYGATRKEPDAHFSMQPVNNQQPIKPSAYHSSFHYPTTPPMTSAHASPVKRRTSPCTMSINTDLANHELDEYAGAITEFVPNGTALAVAADDEVPYVPANGMLAATAQVGPDGQLFSPADYHPQHHQNLVHHGRLESGGPVTLTQAHDPLTLTTPTIVVEMNQPPKHIYVSELPSVVDEVILRKAFRRFGRIDDIRLSKTKMTGNLNGVAYVKFAFSDSVIKALASDGDVVVSGKSIKIAPTDPTENPTRKLFFANVWDLTQDDLLPVCKQFGEVIQVDVVADRGMMYVHFKELKDAVKAHRALQGLTINNRYVRVEFGQSAANYEAGGHRFHHNHHHNHNHPYSAPGGGGAGPMANASQSYPMYYQRPHTVGYSYPTALPPQQLRPGSAPTSYHMPHQHMMKGGGSSFPCEYSGAYDPYAQQHMMRSRGPSFNGDLGSYDEINAQMMMGFHRPPSSGAGDSGPRYSSSRLSPRLCSYTMPPPPHYDPNMVQWMPHHFPAPPRMYPPHVSAPMAYSNSQHADHDSFAA